MMIFLRILKEGLITEYFTSKKSFVIIMLTILQAITFLFLVSLFALTGSKAPTAIVSNDTGVYAREFIQNLSVTHHSFALYPMSLQSAKAKLHNGNIVAYILLPSTFSSDIAKDKPVTLKVVVDNVNIDFTDDIRRAIPSAIVSFGKHFGFYGVTVQLEEHAILPHETSYLSYLLVSALALDAFIISALLGSMLIAKEFEMKTILLLKSAPVHPLIALSGKILAIWFISFGAMILVTCIVLFGFKIEIKYLLLLFPLIALVTFLFTCVGIAFGSIVRRIIPVSSVIFGLSIPLYLISGSLEPERFDGTPLWIIGHCFPVYYAVALFEYVFHGFQVTPEPIGIDFFVFIIWALFSLWIAVLVLTTSLKRS